MVARVFLAKTRGLLGCLDIWHACRVDIDHLITSIGENQHGVMNRRQLSAAGISGDALRHRVKRGALIPLSPAVLRLAGAPQTQMQVVMAGILDAPAPAYLSHRSAAAFWRIPGHSLSPPIQVTVPWQGITRRTRFSEIHFHRALPAQHLLEVGGVSTVSPALAIFLMAGTEPRGRVERSLDNALSMRLTNNQAMHELLKTLAARGRDGIAIMRSLLEVRPADYLPPQSGLEARVVRLAMDVGVRLVNQVDVGNQVEWLGRVDFKIEDSNDVIEVLSERYHSAYLDKQLDAERFRRIEETGRRILCLWDSEVWNRPEVVRQQILAFSRGKAAW